MSIYQLIKHIIVAETFMIVIVFFASLGISILSNLRFDKRMKAWEERLPPYEADDAAEPTETWIGRWSTVMANAIYWLFTKVWAMICWAARTASQMITLLPRKWQEHRRKMAEAAKQAAAEQARIKHQANLIEALSGAQWELINTNSWSFRGFSEDGGVYCFGQMMLRSLGYGLFVINYRKGSELVDTTAPWSHLVAMDGDQCIGDREWALAYVQRIIEQGFEPTIGRLGEVNAAMFTGEQYSIMANDDGFNMVFVGWLAFGNTNRHMLLIWRKRNDYVDSNTLWGLTWFDGNPPTDSRHINLGTNDVAQATADAVEALRQGMPPRLGMWSEVSTNQSA